MELNFFYPPNLKNKYYSDLEINVAQALVNLSHKSQIIQDNLSPLDLRIRPCSYFDQKKIFLIILKKQKLFQIYIIKIF